ncbi:hypothetical protein M885DRAFT_610542 [Pelagophyceae sp. CCMP2097]|nr:hypothetical protein M885DRAFT_610542 [Pelagophyceae sp. CCMP2097]
MLFAFGLCLLACSSALRPGGVSRFRRSVAVEAELQLFVANLDVRTSPVELRGAFEHACAVVDVRVPRDAATGRGKGYAFLTTSVENLDGDEGGLCTARRLNGTRLSGRKLVVTLDRREVFRKDVDLNDKLKSCGARDAAALHAARGAATWSACNVATALHRIGTERGAGADASAVDALIDHATVEINAGSFDARGLATAAWAVGRLGSARGSSSFFDAVIAATTTRLGDMKTQELANLAHGCARAGRFELTDALGAEALQRPLKSFEPASLVALCGALAKAPRSSATLKVLAALADDAATLDALDQRALSETALSASRALGRDEHLFAGYENAAYTAVLDAVSPRLNATSMPARSLAAAASAYADSARPEIVERICLAASLRLAEVEPWEVARLVSAAAKAGAVPVEMFCAVAELSTERLAAFDADALTDVVGAFCKCRLHSAKLFGAVALEVVRRADALEPRHLAVTAASFATVGHDSISLFEAVGRAAERRAGDFKGGELARLASALAIARALKPSTFQVVLSAVASRRAEFGPLDLARLHNAVMFAQANKFPAVDAVLADATKRAYVETARPLFHRALKSFEEHMYLEAGWESELHVTEQGLRLEMARPADKVAIIFDLPQNFVVELDGSLALWQKSTLSRSANKSESMESKFKKRVLRRLGWHRIVACGGRHNLCAQANFQQSVLSADGWRLARVTYRDWTRAKDNSDTSQRTTFVDAKIAELR